MLRFEDLLGPNISRLGDEVSKHASKSSTWLYRRVEVFPTMTRPEIAIVIVTIESPFLDYSILGKDQRELRYCVTESGTVRCVEGDRSYLYHYRYPVEKWLRDLLAEAPQKQAKERTNTIKEELVAAVWHPSRVERMLETHGWDGVEAMG